MAIGARTPGAAKANTGTGNIASIPLAGSAAAGDYLLLPVGQADNVVSTLAAWGSSILAVNGNTINRLAAWGKIMAAGEATPTVTHAAGNSALARMLGFTGVDPVTPIAQIGATNTGTFTGTATAVALGITPKAGNAVVMLVASGEASTAGGTPNYGTTTPWSGTNPTLVELIDSLTGLGSAEATIGAAWGISDGSATGNRSVSISGVDGSAGSSWVAVLIELNAATAAIPTDDTEPYDESGPVGDFGPDPFSEIWLPPTASAPQVFQVSIPVTLTLTPVIVRQVNRVVAPALTLTPTVSRVVNRNVAANLTLTAAVSRVVQRNFALALTLSPAVSRVVQRNLALALTLTPAVALARILTRTIAVALTLTPTVTRTVNRSIASALTLTPTVSRVVNRSISTALTFTAAVSRQVNRTVGVVLNLVPNVGVVKITGTITNIAINAVLTLTPSVSLSPKGLVGAAVKKAKTIYLSKFGEY